MEDRHIIQLVPKIPPPFCGVGDYALSLAKAWESSGSSSHLEMISGDEWRQPDFRASITLGRAKGTPTLFLLHYSGYGYAKRGAPFWLVHSLRQFRRSHPDIHLVTMFHEVAATGTINSSAFWLNPLQKWVARQLDGISDFSLTNCVSNATLLGKVTHQKRDSIAAIPVFSNLGELETLPEFSDRERRLILFSSNFGGRPHDPSFWASVDVTAKNLRVTGITLIGKPVPVVPSLSVPITQTGILEAAQVSSILSSSRFGYAFLGPRYFGKSGIFAAFASHGVIPVVPVDSESLPDGLTAHTHYLPAHSMRPTQTTDKALEAQSRSVFEWYRPHCLKATAAFYAQLIERSSLDSHLSIK